MGTPPKTQNLQTLNRKLLNPQPSTHGLGPLAGKPRLRGDMGRARFVGARSASHTRAAQQWLSLGSIGV